jgi:hypothetical protein
MTKLWNQLRCPSANEWIKKMWCVYTMECYSVIKKNKIISLQENISITGDHYVKKNEPNWERQILHVLCHVPNLDLRKTMCVKLGLLGMRTSGRQTVKGEGEGGWIWSKYFVYIYENRIMKSTENCLKSERGLRKSNRGSEFDQSILYV